MNIRNIVSRAKSGARRLQKNIDDRQRTKIRTRSAKIKEMKQRRVELDRRAKIYEIEQAERKKLSASKTRLREAKLSRVKSQIDNLKKSIKQVTPKKQESKGIFAK